jgi:MerR family transcriptional regulator, heat shock protein HspR
MISAVAEMYDIHPQTLRLYEREGLLIPSRSEGNTRFYTDEDLEALETILSLTRDLGVNLAGVEIILNMRKRMEEMQKEMQAFVKYVEKEIMAHPGEPPEEVQNALVRVIPPYLIRMQRSREKR